MLIVEMIAKVRRDHRVHKKAITEIARSRGLSRNTVRKIPRGGATEFTYERGLQPQPKLGAFVAPLEAITALDPVQDAIPLDHRVRRQWISPPPGPSSW